ncbi:hypothetical protein Mapa_001760 [Marchantia paleacea]|nr:hypothetical protein Mapa_001760 [Marchantia paleacea]
MGTTTMYVNHLFYEQNFAFRPIPVQRYHYSSQDWLGCHLLISTLRSLLSFHPSFLCGNFAAQPENASSLAPNLASFTRILNFLAQDS